MASIQFEEEQNRFPFQSFMYQEKRNNNGGMEEIFQESCIPSFGTNNTTNSASQFNAPNSSTFVTNDIKLDEKDKEEELLIDQFEIQDHLQPQTQIRSAKMRKTQKVIKVFHMTKEDWTTDEWGWRKYGQRIMKRAPFQRSYYRCSSSKGCYAKRYVEKSPTDQSLYIVTYIRDHTHPPPTYINPLRGRPRVRNNFIKGIEEELSTNSSPYHIPDTIPGHYHNYKQTDVSGINMVLEQKEAEYNEEDDIFQGLADLGNL